LALIYVFYVQLLAALVPLAGAVAFLWFAGREMVQGTVSYHVPFFFYLCLVVCIGISTCNFIDACLVVWIGLQTLPAIFFWMSDTYGT
jgi:hypothetical protein